MSGDVRKLPEQVIKTPCMQLPLSNCSCSETLIHDAVPSHSIGGFFTSCDDQNAAPFARYLRAAFADNTRRAYRSDIAHFLGWGGAIPATPELVAKYLAVHAGPLSVATLERRLAGISKAHASHGFASPTCSALVRTTMRGIRRIHCVPQRRVTPTLHEHILAMVKGLSGLRGMRDTAILLIGFAGAFRRSELAGLKVKNLEYEKQGLTIYLNRSKTDPEGKGRKIAIPYAHCADCPVLALDTWLKASGISTGPVFRSIDRHGNISSFAITGQTVANVVKAHAPQAGLDPKEYAGHSLRAGLVTSAVQAGVPIWKVQKQTGHKSEAMLVRYIRENNLFADNAAGEVFCNCLHKPMP